MFFDKLEMKILLIMPWIKQGGAELIAVQAAHQLRQLGHEVRLAALFVDYSKMSLEATKINYLTLSKKVSHWLQKSKTLCYFLGPFFLLRLVLREARWADVLFPHSLPSYWVASVAGKLCRKKVIWLCNEPPRKRKPGEAGFADWLMWRMADSFLDRLFVQGVNKVIVYSRGIAQEVKQRYQKGAILARLGTDFNFFSKTDRKETSGLKRKHRLDNKFVLLMVGKLHPQKNQRLAVEVLANILPRVKNAVLVLVGEGSDKEKLRIKSEKLKIGDKVVFVGFCPPETVRAWYAVADLVLFPSVGQTALVGQSWGFIPFEALCQEKISIVARGCGAAEVLDEEQIGVICPPTVADFSLAALAVFEEKKKYGEMGKRGRLYVKNNFSWERWGRKIEKVLAAK